MSKRKRGGRYTPSKRDLEHQHQVLMLGTADGELGGAFDYSTLEAVWFGDPASCAFCAGRPMHHYHGEDPCPHCAGRDLMACPTMPAELRQMVNDCPHHHHDH